MSMLKSSDIKDVPSEAGVIATVILHPEMVYYSEQLTPHHFTNEQNGYMYFAICSLVHKGIYKIDAYNITNILNSHVATREKASTLLTIPAINDFIQNASVIARSSPEEYKMVADKVLDAAFRREAFTKLEECQRMCADFDNNEVEKDIYAALDGVMLAFSAANDIPQYKDVVDDLWSDIEKRQGGHSGIPFKFPSVNKYATIDPGELFIFAAEAKQGKSMILLNEAVDLMKQGYRVMYIDSELNSRTFTCRMIAHLTGIEFKRVRDGRYGEQEAKKIDEAIYWLKKVSFTHLYMPMFNKKDMYTAIKKVNHTQGIDVLIIDYFKSSDSGDAYATYAELGAITNMIKNEVCGKLDIAGLGAVQATSTGKVADSAKIIRNTSVLALIQSKTPEEIETDGYECGNKKLQIKFNRNGEQMVEGEYIDLRFDGNHILYEEARQHVEQRPY